MINNIKNFIIKLRNSDDATKKKWLIILSGASMVIVVGLWLVYFNWSLQKISPAPQQALPAGRQASAEASGIKETLDDLKSTLDNGLKAIKEQLGRGKSYDFSAAERNFILEKAGDIPKNKLP